MQGIIRGIREQIIAIDEGAEAALRYRLANQGLEQSEIDLIAALENVRKQAAEEKRLSEESAESDRKKAEDKKNFIKSINEQAAALGKTSIELLREKAAIHGVTTELDEAFQTLEKFKQDQEDATERQRIESNVEAIRQSLLTEEEILLAHNPSLLKWKPLITERGFPFIKTELLKQNRFRLKNIEEWKAVVESGDYPALKGKIEQHLSHLGIS